MAQPPRFQKKTPNPQQHEQELQKREKERYDAVQQYWIKTHHTLASQQLSICQQQFEVEQIDIPRQSKESQAVAMKNQGQAEREFVPQPELHHILPKQNPPLLPGQEQYYTYPPPPPVPTIPTPDQDLFSFFDLYPLIIQSGLYIEQSLAPEHSLGKAILPDVTINTNGNQNKPNQLNPHQQLGSLIGTSVTHIVIEPELHPDLTHTGVVHDEFGKLLQKAQLPSSMSGSNQYGLHDGSNSGTSTGNKTATGSASNAPTQRHVIEAQLPLHIP